MDTDIVASRLAGMLLAIASLWLLAIPPRGPRRHLRRPGHYLYATLCASSGLYLALGTCILTISQHISSTWSGQPMPLAVLAISLLLAVWTLLVGGLGLVAPRKVDSILIQAPFWSRISIALHLLTGLILIAEGYMISSAIETLLTGPTKS